MEVITKGLSQIRPSGGTELVAWGGQASKEVVRKNQNISTPALRYSKLHPFRSHSHGTPLLSCTPPIYYHPLPILHQSALSPTLPHVPPSLRSLSPHSITTHHHTSPLPRLTLHPSPASHLTPPPPHTNHTPLTIFPPLPPHYYTTSSTCTPVTQYLPHAPNSSSLRHPSTHLCPTSFFSSCHPIFHHLTSPMYPSLLHRSTQPRPSLPPSSQAIIPFSLYTSLPITNNHLYPNPNIPDSSCCNRLSSLHTTPAPFPLLHCPALPHNAAPPWELRGVGGIKRVVRREMWKRKIKRRTRRSVEQGGVRSSMVERGGVGGWVEEGMAV
ncbi:hypothetical protein Pcinc_039046 [Petrolisthes cinctipes]|uniref:Uncharacterized protein n=1 Tax=Petrolisthes cinctipes TaxID=88211 RepID=A0AAE1BPA5_PETCI|nr:hypothetical protein Pcinc_039046 [Petrolisthes cinctipes]